MLNRINSYIPSSWQPTWMLDDNKDDDALHIIEGDLVEFDSWDCTRDPKTKEVLTGYEGCGIVHYFTRAEFKNLETGQFEFLPCAVVVSANPDTDWHDAVPVQNLDPLTLNRYISLYQEEYGELSPVSEMSLRQRIARRMQKYSPVYRNWYVSPMQDGNGIVPFPATATGGAQ